MIAADHGSPHPEQPRDAATALPLSRETRFTAGDPARLTDVARAAGVSVMTASRVANSSGGVREETRARVLAAMRELNYRPHTTARALKTGRASTLGLIFARPSSQMAPAKLLFEIEHAAGEAGYDVHLLTLREMTAEALTAAVDRLSARPVGAIIVVSVHASTRDAIAGLRSGIPVIAVWPDDDLPVPTVRADQRDHARLATRHLLELGHRQVQHIAGPPSWTLTEVRIAGWQDELVASGITPPPVVWGDWSPRSGYETARHLLANPAVTAVFVANDSMALGVLAAARELGRDVPRDLSVVGFDDDPAAEFAAPPLTTVRLDQAMLGHAAVEMATAQIEGRTVPPQVPIPATLVVRASTCPPQD